MQDDRNDSTREPQAAGPRDQAATPPAPQDAPGHPDLGEPASVHVLTVDQRSRLVLAGEIDAKIAGDLQNAISEAEGSRLPVEIDAHHVTFMDSSGVAFLARLASRSPHKVRVLRAPPTVRFLLEVTRIGDLLEIVDEDLATN
ncbi:STAS domain-containing protein [Myceligenerans salitolerans]|uniref:STAS domain-containing protein n=1 Tax=Myceligenerans salitolerans TaxID=1230528 RepID=UPI0027DD95C9|nr:STAS domain-containing protein [Myceligenerans salitolerans]